MNESLSQRTTTAAAKVSSETTQLRRRVARADQLFSEGLARLQSDYKGRLRAAVLGDSEPDEETVQPETAPAAVEQPVA